jgi:hypothetical protein
MKASVAAKLVEELQTMTPPGQFLEWRGNGYVVAPDKVAIEKTAQALRERKWSPFCREEAYETLNSLNKALLSGKVLVKDIQIMESTKKVASTIPSTVKHSKVIPLKKESTTAKTALLPFSSKASSLSINNAQNMNDHKVGDISSFSIFSAHALKSLKKIDGREKGRKSASVSKKPAARRKERLPTLSLSSSAPSRSKFKRLDRLVKEALSQERALYLATLPP